MKGIAVQNLKYIFSFFWNETRSVFYLLLASLAIVIFIIIFATSAQAESFKLCTARCAADVMDIDQCIKDERQHWKTNRSEVSFRRSCQDLIRNERLNCYGDCEKDRVQNQTAINFHDTQVKNFPITNE